MKKDCPELGKTTAIQGDDSVDEQDLAKLSSIISSVETKGPKDKGLMFVDITLAGQELDALVDTSASELFMSEQVAQGLGLRVEKASGSIKTVNCKSTPIAGVARGVKLIIGDWSVKENIKVIPLDDFDVVIGIDFLDRIKAFPVSFCNCLYILDPTRPCMVKTKRQPEVRVKMVSTIQLEKGRKRVPPPLGTRAHEKPTTTKGVSMESRQVTSKSWEPTSPESLRQETEHKIELVPMTGPPAQARSRKTKRRAKNRTNRKRRDKNF
ncbi:hypothetical protein HRI_000155700 [Hibiscus trionum]|uniref:Aspartic peptidase DDI1-type domain-containing protein n=1 Tax=Hibiscus trionum TaxID=183268 RepID=A0A9W7LI19_HIBTR|nr:hypothetical protein HRI_000155700 [Hibiscus trionum]